MKKTIKDVGAALGEFELALGELRNCIAPDGCDLETLDDPIGNVAASITLMGDGVRELRKKVDELLANRLELCIASLLADSEENDERQAMAAVTAAIAVLDRSKLEVGLGLVTADELRGFAYVALAQLRQLTGNAAIPHGGVQA